MKNSRELIEQVCAGQKPARTPIFDLLCNDAVVAHYAGAPLNGDDDMAKMFAAAGRALDGPRSIFPPMQPGTTTTDEMGNIHVAARWTSWISYHALRDADDWTRLIFSLILAGSVDYIPHISSAYLQQASSIVLDFFIF